MLEPRAIGKALGIGESAFTVDEHLVDRREGGGRECGAAIGVGLFESFSIFPSAAIDGIQGVFHRSEIQVRGDGFDGRRNQRLLWIIGGLKNSFLDFLVALLDVVLHFLRKSFQLLQVGLHRVG